MSVDKKTTAKWQMEFQTHVNIVMLQDQLPKAKAMVIAYQEGPSGLSVRMAKPMLSLQPTVN